MRWTLGRKQRVEEVKSAGTLASPDDTLLALFQAQPALSGVAVTPKTAMRSPAARCAIQSIAEAVGQLPLLVYSRGEDGSKTRDPKHPNYELLHDQANEWTSASDFREQLTRDALLHDAGGFAFINRVDGKVQELLRLSPEAMTVKADPTSGEPVYTYSQNGQQRPMARQDVLHIKAASLDGTCGVCPTTQGKEAIALSLVLEQHAARLFAKGGRPSGILKFPHKLGDTVAARIKASWKAAHSGTASGDTAVVEEGGDFVPLSFNSVDSQFLELRAFAVAEIARIYRVPPILLQDYGRATWSNSEAMGLQFLQYCLLPWLKRWEGEIRLKLFAVEERKTHFAEFLVDDLLRADFAQRMTGYSTAISSRILNPNEVRAAENRPPYPAGNEFINPNTSTNTPAPAPKLREAA